MVRELGILLNFVLLFQEVCFAQRIAYADDIRYLEGQYEYFFGPRSDQYAATTSYTLWFNMPDGHGNWIMPYKIHKKVKAPKLLKAIENALLAVESVSCIKFKERTDEVYYFLFTDSDDGTCYAYMGRSIAPFQPNEVNLGHKTCHTKGIVLHEILHTLGFLHEHQRPDRDKYVKIHPQNVMSGMMRNFAVSRHINSFGSPYDYGSVMHYPSDALADPGRGFTVTKKDGSEITEHQVTKLARSDILQMNHLYKCPASASCTDTWSTEECNEEKKKGSCRKKSWKMAIRCRRTCKLCDCSDEIKCESQKKRCYRKIFLQRMKVVCPLTCGYCGKGCVDTKDDCAKYLKDGGCPGQKIILMARYCRKTCGHCV